MPDRILLSAAERLSLAITALLGGPPWTPLGTIAVPLLARWQISDREHDTLIAVPASLLASAGPAL